MDSVVYVLNTEHFMSIIIDNLSSIFLLESLLFSKSGINFHDFIVTQTNTSLNLSYLPRIY